MHSKSAMRERNRKEVLQNLSPDIAGQMALNGQRWIKEKMVFWVGTCTSGFLAMLVTGMGCQTYGPKENIGAGECMFILKVGGPVHG